MTVPHFAFPFTLSGPAFATREQDTAPEVRDCVTVLLLTPVGSRIALPSYGTPELLFIQDTAVPPGILPAVNRWEPRATVNLQAIVDGIDPKILNARVTITGGSR